MKNIENKTKTYSVKFEKVLSDAFSAYLKKANTTSSKTFRSLIIKLLIENGFLPVSFKDEMKQGGDKWTAKLNSSNQEERINARNQLKKQVEKMCEALAAKRSRAAKAAKIKISGNVQGSGSVISGSDCVVSIDNSQKILPK